ncbi:MAG: Glycosyltransferase [Bacteroidetes bacterium HLUCCA01]|nr:MAG: Glycosyltransferase [Bacteroidetes bacterium HLUCCA01]
MRILHISNTFARVSVYKELINGLSEFGFKNSVFAPVKNEEETRYDISNVKSNEIVVKEIINYFDKIFFRRKCSKIYNSIIDHINIKNIDHIHAHTLYSDGYPAYKLYRKYGIPYTITIRSSDINAYSLLRKDLIFIRNKIINNASNIIFTSPSQKNKYLNNINLRLRKEVIKKYHIIPNGISNTFFSNYNPKVSNNLNKISILYIGRFLKLKNIPNLIKAIDIVRNKYEVRLTIVGGGGNDQHLIKKMINKRNNYVTLLDYVKDENVLINLYRSHDIFAMVSKPETFGLVYIEALSQGLPIIYTAGEGVDGYFDHTYVGEKVKNPKNVNEIANKIINLIVEFNNDIVKKSIIEAEKFKWNNIIKEYRNIYK